MQIPTYSDSDLQDLIEKSRTHPRRRALHAFNAPEYPGPQIIFNAMQPESYLPPHNHTLPEVWMPLRGWFLLGTFSESGDVREVFSLHKNKTNYVEIPSSIYHTAISMDQHSVFMNVNPGPHTKDKNTAPWAPEKDRLEDIAEWETYFEEITNRIINRARSSGIL
jgi:cupin fold WbuC family metalloprotein